jgi:hypothetical protein
VFLGRGVIIDVALSQVRPTRGRGKPPNDALDRGQQAVRIAAVEVDGDHSSTELVTVQLADVVDGDR